MNLIQLERQRQCFGCTENELREGVESCLTFKVSGYQSVAMSMMSDAQEAMERNDNESARQLLNCAKWVLSNYRSVK